MVYFFQGGSGVKPVNRVRSPLYSGASGVLWMAINIPGEEIMGLNILKLGTIDLDMVDWKKNRWGCHATL
jgi:hypothetical protein